MSTEDKLYRDLQKHLDEQTFSFPAMESGADIRLLKELFPPDQAKMTMMCTYKYETLEQIHERANKIGVSIEELEHGLDKVRARGLIVRRTKDGVKQYRNIPYLLGMGEARYGEKANPEFMKAHAEFMQEGTVIGDFLSTKVPMLRTVPISKSITPEHKVGSYDELKNFLETTTDMIAIVECRCRKVARSQGTPCKMTSRKETCMGFAEHAEQVVETGLGRQISNEEALEIIKKNEEDGLVLMAGNSQEPRLICSCCGCCCGVFKVHKAIPNPVSHWATNFYAEVDNDLCTGCGNCVETCQADAMSMDDEEEMAMVDLSRCLGCGQCVTDCPAEAIELRKKEPEVVPPLTGEDQDEIIMANK